MYVEGGNGDVLSEESRKTLKKTWELIPLERRALLFNITRWTEGDVQGCEYSEGGPHQT